MLLRRIKRSGRIEDGPRRKELKAQKITVAEPVLILSHAQAWSF